MTNPRLWLLWVAALAAASCSGKPAPAEKAVASPGPGGPAATGMPPPLASPTAPPTPGPGVVWERDVGTALVGAAAASRPCVVLLGKPPNNDYQLLVRQFEDSRFEPLRRISVWARGDPDTDSYAKTIVDTLHVASLPAVVILEPTGDLLKEAGRVTGYADAASLEERLAPAIRRVYESWQSKIGHAPTPTP